MSAASSALSFDSDDDVSRPSPPPKSAKKRSTNGAANVKARSKSVRSDREATAVPNAEATSHPGPDTDDPPTKKAPLNDESDLSELSESSDVEPEDNDNEEEADDADDDDDDDEDRSDDDGDEEDDTPQQMQRGGRRRKRGSLLPGPMWDWAYKNKTGKSLFLPILAC
jgi:hypothetical protein